MEPAIKVENVSKAYNLGAVGTGTLSRDLERWYSRIRGKEDPYLKIGEINDRESKGQGNIVLSLNDVSFEVAEGTAVGIIGANGAGKSTLLKLLSRVTSPTTGKITGKGKISSLLEVGTGFHPELTGRENIFLNGAILGMKKKDILKNFDEIVSFAGVERYVDTPVKRYSSGMYVRLAFAVAAHLEPDILIIDEVLAVGDAEFQKKCLGKMNEVSSQLGRTILFVSHNMQAINNLCSTAIWLDKGSIRSMGKVRPLINEYLSVFQNKSWKKDFTADSHPPGNEHICIQKVEMSPRLPENTSSIDVRTAIDVCFSFINHESAIRLVTSLLLFNVSGECIFDITSPPQLLNSGFVEGKCSIPGNFLNDGGYYFSLYFVRDSAIGLYEFERCLEFEVADYRENTNWFGKWWGHVRPNFPLSISQVAI